MSNSFFDDKTAESYCVSIISFDDDYYYGQFWRRYTTVKPESCEKNFVPAFYKQFLCNFQLDLDDFPQVSFFNNPLNVSRQTLVDFEIDPSVPDTHDRLMDLLATEIGESSDLIFKALKQEGGTVHLIVR